MLGRRVVVYGGGNTAIDVARTARRLGATEAIIVYRRTREKMPAHDFELEEALQEGVMVKWLSTIKQAGETSITVEKMALDETGFPQPTGELETLEADRRARARPGRRPRPAGGRAGLEVEGGVVKVGPNMMTGHPGIFAGGDMVPSERTVTVGIGHGKKAARHIDAWLRGTPTCRRPSTRSRRSTSSTPGTTRTRRRPCARSSTSSGASRRSTRCRAGSTRPTRCSKRAAASHAETASSATTATACARTTRSSSSGPGKRSSSTTIIARAAGCALRVPVRRDQDGAGGITQPGYSSVPHGSNSSLGC